MSKFAKHKNVHNGFSTIMAKDTPTRGRHDPRGFLDKHISRIDTTMTDLPKKESNLFWDRTSPYVFVESSIWGRLARGNVLSNSCETYHLSLLVIALPFSKAKMRLHFFFIYIKIMIIISKSVILWLTCGSGSTEVKKKCG